MKLAVGRSIGMLALVAALGVMAATPARADALDEAKAAGYVGERYDGYLGLVRDDAPASAQALVEDINARRKAHYARIAKQENTSVEAVAAIAGEKLVENAPSGHYVKPGPSGLWVKAP